MAAADVVPEVETNFRAAVRRVAEHVDTGLVIKLPHHVVNLIELDDMVVPLDAHPVVR